METKKNENFERSNDFNYPVYPSHESDNLDYDEATYKGAMRFIIGCGIYMLISLIIHICVRIFGEG